MGWYGRGSIKGFLNWMLKAFPDIKRAQDAFDQSRVMSARRACDNF